ncbi:MAG: MaoC/PaaZ C-terminal domain-containing protein [Halieaceae bacterium]|uniref:MaoC/PaaZ C-terminal domain-containing protein n=1 Tax=Haliea alexandrii TaxID=2448162 RepID=UPI000F0B86AF|nr:MaoC/PaaZ C-terminal domain-containing protein [Haliea alexandrii]MCR9187126.1 MaoC/PaaZ C-terminal domain-containing protein [Halieaceae bacterium]
MSDPIKQGQVKVGDTLPPREIAITTSLIVSGALATRDFQKVHHDKAVAQASGMPDVFMNILTTQGLTESYLRDWCGRDAVFRKLTIHLGAPNIPGTTMTMSGEVKSCADGLVEVEVVGQNSQWGMHVKALATIALPV